MASTSTFSSQFNPNWYPDSGATNHMIPDGNILQNPIPYTGFDKVKVGNSEGLTIQQIGQCDFNKFQLKNTLHVPSLVKNLLSVS